MRCWKSAASSVPYEELLEEALVGQPPDLRATASVQLVASPDEGEFEDLLDSAVDDLCRGEHAASSLQLPLDAFLFLSGGVFGDGAGDQAAGESAASFSSPTTRRFARAISGCACWRCLSSSTRSPARMLSWTLSGNRSTGIRPWRWSRHRREPQRPQKTDPLR
jgi:hypothetical protein